MLSLWTCTKAEEGFPPTSSEEMDMTPVGPPLTCVGDTCVPGRVVDNTAMLPSHHTVFSVAWALSGQCRGRGRGGSHESASLGLVAGEAWGGHWSGAKYIKP